jgi:hypothetical protein
MSSREGALLNRKKRTVSILRYAAISFLGSKWHRVSELLLETSIFLAPSQYLSELYGRQLPQPRTATIWTHEICLPILPIVE